MTYEQHAREAARQFQIPGKMVEISPYGSGHINDTYCAVFSQSGKVVRYIIQRINPTVFQNPPLLMQNIQRVTEHLSEKLADHPESNRRVLRLVRTRDGSVWYQDANGNYWRSFHFIERTRSYDAISSVTQAFEVAKAFGEFQQLLFDLPAPPLHETIPDFHNTPKRFTALEQALDKDIAGRAVLAKPEIEFALERKAITSVLLDANLRMRVTHNDTKLNNVLLDDLTGAGVCVIDLDTVMPGLALYDFGDMVRTSTSPTLEDEQDLSKVTMQFPMFEALVRGYLSFAGNFLTDAEEQLLAFSGKLITFEQGIRSLTDYLRGDLYYKVSREGHNLDRSRTQFRLVESIEQQEEKMSRLVENVLK